MRARGRTNQPGVPPIPIGVGRPEPHISERCTPADQSNSAAIASEMAAGGDSPESPQLNWAPGEGLNPGTQLCCNRTERQKKMEKGQSWNAPHSALRRRDRFGTA